MVREGGVVWPPVYPGWYGREVYTQVVYSQVPFLVVYSQVPLLVYMALTLVYMALTLVYMVHSGVVWPIPVLYGPFRCYRPIPVL